MGFDNYSQNKKVFSGIKDKKYSDLFTDYEVFKKYINESINANREIEGDWEINVNHGDFISISYKDKNGKWCTLEKNLIEDLKLHKDYKENVKNFFVKLAKEKKHSLSSFINKAIKNPTDSASSNKLEKENSHIKGNRCSAILKSGERQNKPCGYSAQNGNGIDRCGFHLDK
jgi:hypothetical protein